MFSLRFGAANTREDADHGIVKRVMHRYSYCYPNIQPGCVCNCINAVTFYYIQQNSTKIFFLSERTFRNNFSFI